MDACDGCLRIAVDSLRYSRLSARLGLKVPGSSFPQIQYQTQNQQSPGQQDTARKWIESN